ncbi:MAG: ATP-binding cassette domain-containing protein [Caulobacteraceae bacterium]
MEPVLSVENLSVAYATNRGLVHALRDINLTVRQGEVLGLVGESGSGKTTLATAMMAMLPANARVEAGWRSRGATSSPCPSGSAGSCAGTARRWSSRTRSPR